MSQTSLSQNVSRFNTYNRSLRGRYRALRYQARSQYIEFTLTLEEFKALVHRRSCTYCGGRLPKVGYGLDRVRPEHGYTPGNVVPCCRTCNQAKSNLSVRAFKGWLRRITRFLKLKK